MRKSVCWAVMVAMIALVASAVAAGGAKKKASSKKRGTTSSTAVKKKSGKTASAKRRAATWRNRQMEPTPERYKEIQQALVSKGYLRPEDATGTWGASSVDALKRFQTEQKLDPSGKINSVSLIALGLGPKRETPAASAEGAK